MVRSALPAAFVAIWVPSVPAGWSTQPADDALRAQIAKIAKIKKRSFEDTKRTHNEKLGELFADYVKAHGGKPTVELVRQFHALLKAQNMTTFEDFLDAQTKPLRFVKDPDSGDEVPILGALGSDAINTWLAALEPADGKPLDEQPLYQLAANALREHLDFAIVGTPDPSLSLGLLPEKLREHAKDAYERLNPQRAFGGGFDHPLYYAVVREAVKQLFAIDYPKARQTLADVVVPEAKGGMGIRSCLLCHDGDYTAIYRRVEGQHRYRKAKAAELTAAGRDAAAEQALAAEFGRAAEELLAAHRDKIDATAVAKSLQVLSTENIDRLKPGYQDFCTTLDRLGCMQCHSTDRDVADDKDPRAYGAYMLEPSEYYKTENIKALLSVVNLDNLDESDLVLKAVGEVTHEGKRQVKLNAAQKEELRAALAKWVHSFGAK